MASPDLQAPPIQAPASPVPPAPAGGAAAPVDGGSFAPFGDDGLTFADLLDIVNPLQHIPIIGTLYRHLTGDALDAGARVIGGALFGGPVGIAIAGVNVLLEESTGRDAGDHVLALFTDGDAAPTAETAVAAAGPSGAVPDLGLLGPLPTATPDARPSPAPPIDLAALAPLAPAPSAPRVATMPDATGQPRSRAVPPGATAADGGWFAQTMLAALEKYQDAARLAAY